MPHSNVDSESSQYYLLEDLSTSPGVHHRPSEYNIDDAESTTQRPNRSILWRLLSPFSFSAERRKSRINLDGAPTLGFPHDIGRTHAPRELRRFRRSIVLRFLRRGVCALPVLILIFFGTLHVLEAVVGRTSLFWNDAVYEHAFLGRFAQVHNLASRLKYQADITKGVVPIPCHSHNDYWRDEPLFDAIRWGCTSVEADVWLFDGELYVGHSPAELTEDRTLQSLYINPLLELLEGSISTSRISQSATRGIFNSKPAQTLVLLIDFKRAGQDTLQVVQQQLQPLRGRDLLSFWDGEEVISRAVTIVGTGNIPFDMVVDNSSYRDIFLDAPLSALWEPPRESIGHSDVLHNKDGEIDYGSAMSLSEVLDADSTFVDIDADLFNTSTSYYASTSFSSTVGFVWRGHLSPRQMNIIRGQIRGAKRRGLKARYWNTPAWPTALRNHIWHVLIKEGADVLNVDDLKAAALQDWTIPVHDEFV